MLTKSSMVRLLLLLCAVFGFTAAPVCWGASAPIAAPGDLQLVLPGPAFGAASLSQGEVAATSALDSGATTLAATYELEYATLSDPNAQSVPSAHTANSSSSVKILLKRYSQKIGIPAHLTEGFDGFSNIKCRVDEIDDALVGGLIGVASSYVFAEPVLGWRVKAEGGINNVSFNFKYAW